MKVKDKVCVVTGAAGGIGEAIARRFAKEGAKGVVVADRDAARLQKVADDMRENAVQEAQRLVREAEGKADLLLQKAQARTEDIEREIDGLRIKRREAESTVEATIAALNNTLDFIREQDRRERDQRVVPHRSPLNVASLSA